MLACLLRSLNITMLSYLFCVKWNRTAIHGQPHTSPQTMLSVTFNVLDSWIEITNCPGTSFAINAPLLLYVQITFLCCLVKVMWSVCWQLCVKFTQGNESNSEHHVFEMTMPVIICSTTFKIVNSKLPSQSAYFKTINMHIQHNIRLSDSAVSSSLQPQAVAAAVAEIWQAMDHVGEAGRFKQPALIT